MADLKLTLACWDYDRTRPLIEGRVKPRGIDLEVLVLRPRQMFPRMLENREFHASELSLASYASLIGRGECPFVAIPVAVSKFFRHGCMYVRKGSGIKHPRDLVGKRVGTTQYSSTAVTFMRGMLKDEYGVDAKDMHWFMGGLTKPTETPLIPLDLPSDIRLDFVPEGDTLERMMIEGRVDALLSIYIPKLFEDGWEGIERLFPDFKEVDIALEGLWDTDALRLGLPWLIDHVEEAWRTFGKDFWAYGMEANRPTLEAIGRYVHEQHFSPRVVKPEEIWPDL
jgi:4,5-dihydroxyphthalate decarboxylase